jgi:hypothetical protein
MGASKLVTAEIFSAFLKCPRKAYLLSNNNNAEHAVRAFTRLRNVIGTSTPKGHREYATLLSIQQTLHYRGIGFLEFLRSGRMDVDPRAAPKSNDHKRMRGGRAE